MALGEQVELGEIILIIAGAGIIYYVAQKGLGNLLSNAQVPCALGGPCPEVSGPSAAFNKLGNGQIDPQTAVAIATQLGQSTDYTLSPDRTQIWFFNGSFYDNASRHVFSADGTDGGPLQNADGSIANGAYETVNPSSSMNAFLAVPIV